KCNRRRLTFADCGEGSQRREFTVPGTKGEGEQHASKGLGSAATEVRRGRRGFGIRWRNHGGQNIRRGPEEVRLHYGTRARMAGRPVSGHTSGRDGRHAESPDKSSRPLRPPYLRRYRHHKRVRPWRNISGER